MSEFIREVDEEYRRDQILQFWKRYSGIIIALLILVVVAVGGWRYWQHTQRSRAEAASARYHAATVLARDGKSEESEQALTALAKETDGGYRLLSRFRLADELGKTNRDEAIKAYDALAEDASVSGTWQDLARLRAVMLRFDESDPTALRPALERLAAPTNPWRHTARELLGLSGLKANDYDFASRWFDQIAADPATPQSLRQRLQIYSALVAGGPVQAAP